MSGASKRANGQASGPVLQSGFLIILAHSASPTCPFGQWPQFIDLGLSHGISPDFLSMLEFGLRHGAVKMGQIDGFVVVVSAVVLGVINGEVDIVVVVVDELLVRVFVAPRALFGDEGGVVLADDLEWHSGLKLYEIDACVLYKNLLSQEQGSKRSERNKGRERSEGREQSE